MRAVRVLVSLVMVIGLMSCGEALKEVRTLRAPTSSVPAASAAVEEGNRLFAARQWEGAKVQYEAALKAQPALAEAHYNLAMVLDILEQPGAARKHYVEAANLAPGHQVIWNSPPFRKHGVIDSTSKHTPSVTPDGGLH